MQLFLRYLYSSEGFGAAQYFKLSTRSQSVQTRVEKKLLKMFIFYHLSLPRRRRRQRVETSSCLFVASLIWGTMHNRQ